MDEEMKKIFNDVKKRGVGLLDTTTRKRVDIDSLAIFTKGGEATGDIKKEVILLKDLYHIQKIFDEKFGIGKSPYDITLFKKAPEKFIERMIRATEICTLKYVLNQNGALNKDKHMNIQKKLTKFAWKAK